VLEQFINAIGNVIMKDLKANDIPFFIGGSRRFGYNNKNSDLDIYACMTTIKKLNDYGMKLRQSGFTHGETSLYVETPYNFKGMIHIIIMHNHASFDLLSKEHDEMEAYVNANPLLRAVAVALKRNGVNGTSIYRTFLSVMRADKLQ